MFVTTKKQQLEQFGRDSREIQNYNSIARQTWFILSDSDSALQESYVAFQFYPPPPQSFHAICLTACPRGFGEEPLGLVDEKMYKEYGLIHVSEEKPHGLLTSLSAGTQSGFIITRRSA